MASRQIKKKATKPVSTFPAEIAEAILTFLIRGVQMSSAEIPAFNACTQELAKHCSPEFLAKLQAPSNTSARGEE